MNQIWFQPARQPARGAALPPRERTLRVPGGRCALFTVSAGDALRVVDPEGLQGGLLYALPGTFEASSEGEPPALAALLDAIGEAASARAGLDAGGIGPSDLAGLAILVTATACSSSSSSSSRCSSSSPSPRRSGSCRSRTSRGSGGSAVRP